MSDRATSNRRLARRRFDSARAALLLLITGPLCAAAADRPEPKWIGTWAASPQPPMPGSLEHYENQTLRLIAHVSAGGRRVRIHLSNTFGDRPLVIGAAHIARRTHDANIDPTSDRPLRFNGSARVVIALHAEALSDPVDLDVAPLSDLAVSLFLPQATAAATTHFLAMQTSYVSPATGDAVAATELHAEKTIASWPFLSGIDVAATEDGTAIVAFGDSVVDGDGSTLDANRRWPDLLAARLQRQDTTREISVLNEGIIGNRLLRDSPVASEFGAALGQAGQTRFRRDALDKPGVRYVIVRIGSNDIGFQGALTPATEAVTLDAMISGYRRLIADAHRKNVRIIATTLPPFEGANVIPGYSTAQKDVLRQKINTWLRESGALDAVVDFDAILRDPDHPSRLLPAFDSGDHLHPNDGGYAALADAIPLTLLLRR